MIVCICSNVNEQIINSLIDINKDKEDDNIFNIITMATGACSNCKCCKSEIYKLIQTNKAGEIHEQKDNQEEKTK